MMRLIDFVRFKKCVCAHHQTHTHFYDDEPNGAISVGRRRYTHEESNEY